MPSILISDPTSFSLAEEQVDKPIATGGELLRNNPGLQQSWQAR